MPTTSTTSVDMALVHQHLVDDQLEEDRRRQREHLQEQRGDDHFGERLAIAQDRRQEPAEAERLGSTPAPPSRRVTRITTPDDCSRASSNAISLASCVTASKSRTQVFSAAPVKIVQTPSFRSNSAG